MQELFDSMIREYGAAGIILGVVALLLRKELGAMLTGKVSDPAVDLLGKIEQRLSQMEASHREEHQKLRTTIIKSEQHLVRSNYLLESIKDELQRN